MNNQKSNTLQVLKLIHYTLGLLWLYQGIFPKLLFISRDEIALWQFIGLSVETAKRCGQVSGVIEIIFGLLFIFYPHKWLHYLNVIGMGGLLIGVAIILPYTLTAAFNPVVMNIAMAALSIVALMLYRNTEITN